MTDKETWLIEKGYDRHMRKVNPRTIPRVRESYRVRNRDDPHGFVGEWIERESRASYERRCEAYEEQARKIWAKGLRGFTGPARATALLAPKYDPQAMFDKVQEAHGTKSNKQVTHLVREFVGRSKTGAVKIDAFNRTWTDSVRVLKAHGMELPDQFIVSLYLISLGVRYRTLEAVVSVLPETQRTLSHVMKLAVDHTASEIDDEADNRTVALLAELEQRGYEPMHKKQKTEHAHEAAHVRTTCSICGKPGHDKTQCFAPGGGLSGLTHEERQAYLQRRREQREQERQKRTAHAGTAMVATDARDAQIQALTEKVQLRESQLKNATKIVTESGMVLDLGFDVDKL